MSDVFQNGSDILKLMSDGNVFILPQKSIIIIQCLVCNSKYEYFLFL